MIVVDPGGRPGRPSAAARAASDLLTRRGLPSGRVPERTFAVVRTTASGAVIEVVAAFVTPDAAAEFADGQGWADYQVGSYRTRPPAL